MSLTLRPPRPPKSASYEVRGTYLGQSVERSTRTADRKLALKIKKQIEREIEAGTFTPSGGLSFLEAAVAYMKAGGERKFLGPIINHKGEYSILNKPTSSISQQDLGHMADALYPNATAQTKNRQVYTPIIAVLRHVGIERGFKRPKGWRGKKAKSWMEPDQAFALLAEADKIDSEFGLLCTTCLYTGRRIGELLNDDTRLRHLNIKRGTLYLRDTKTGEAVTVHLPPISVEKFKAMPPRSFRHGNNKGRSQISAGVPFLERDPNQRLFRFHQGGYLRSLLAEAMKNAGLSFPRRECGFHLFCHTYATWMLPLVGDNFGLARTGRWKDPRSAEGYLHTKVSSEARRADLLPTPRPKSGGNTGEENQVIDIKS
jgi:integrase